MSAEYPRIVSRVEWLAALGKIAPFKKRKGWTVRWYSSYGSDFNYDFHVTMDEAVAPVEYGLSAFLRRDDGVFHTYSTCARGTDLLAGTYNYLDLTPMGRQEHWEEPPGRSNSAFLAWVRHHDRYADQPDASASCCGSARKAAGHLF